MLERPGFSFTPAPPGNSADHRTAQRRGQRCGAQQGWPRAWLVLPLSRGASSPHRPCRQEGLPPSAALTALNTRSGRSARCLHRGIRAGLPAVLVLDTHVPGPQSLASPGLSLLLQKAGTRAHPKGSGEAWVRTEHTALRLVHSSSRPGGYASWGLQSTRFLTAGPPTLSQLYQGNQTSFP